MRWLKRSIAPPELGRWGEWIALKHLRKLGWDIVARNWKSSQGEVDLIAYDGPFLVFVEVKTRRRPIARAPEEGVDWQKERKLDELAFNFLLRYEISETPVRIDVIAIETTDRKEYVLRHYRGSHLLQHLAEDIHPFEEFLLGKIQGGSKADGALSGR